MLIFALNFAAFWGAVVKTGLCAKISVTASRGQSFPHFPYLFHAMNSPMNPGNDWHAPVNCASRAGKLLASLLLMVCAGCATAPVPDVCFSPAGHCANAVIREINAARQSIYVQAYGFTHPGIAKALADAEGRGVDVEVILDKSNLSARYSEGGFVAAAGVKTYIDSRHPIAHDKVMVIDQDEVITGSFNFTRPADEKNAENLLILKSRPLAARYLADWRTHRAHSVAYGTAGYR